MAIIKSLVVVGLYPALILFLSANTAQVAPPGDSPSFEVALVKPSGPSEVMKLSMPRGRFVATAVPLRLLITIAFGIKDYQLVGGPSWLDTTRYTIEAKSSGESPSTSLQPMLQKLLAERFKLTSHFGTRTLAIYELVVAKSGLKLTPSKDGGCIVTGNDASPPSLRSDLRPSAPCGKFVTTRGHIVGGKISLPLLAYTLSNIVGQTVEDKTEASGAFDIDLNWDPDVTQGSAESRSNAAPIIFTALEQQLGLKLRPAKGDVQVLIIDRVEKPEEN